MYGQPRFLDEGFKYYNIFFNGVDVDYYFHSWKDEDTLQKINKIYKPKIIVENQIENLESDFNINSIYHIQTKMFRPLFLHE